MKSLKSLILNQFFLLGIIVFVGFGLRMYRLSEIPVGFHIDEAQVGYNAYSLLKTGKDETGRFLPTHLKIWNFERPLGITYLSIPGIMIFGLNEFGTRIDTTLIGVISIILVYFLTKEIFSNKSFALLSALLFAISPWHINLSRATSDAVVSLFFYLLATLFAWKAFKKNSYLFVILSYVFYVFSFFSYYSTRITIPFLLFFFFVISFLSKKKITYSFLLVLFIYIVFPFMIFWGSSTSRFNQVSVFNEKGTQLLLEEQIREDGSNHPIFLTRLFHNKPVNFSLRFLQNFSSYLTSDFLIFKGGYPNRYIIPDMGVIYYWEIIFLFLGIVFLFYPISRDILLNSYFIFLWIFLGGLSSFITIEDTPNIQRALFVLPAFQWLIGLGIIILFRIVGKFKYFFSVFLFIFALWNFLYFLHQYNIHTFSHRPWNRQYEMKELVYYLNSVKDHYKKVVLTFNSSEPYIFFLFYNKTDPITYQKNIKEKGLSYAWNRIDNIEISRRDCPLISKKEKSGLLVVYQIQCYFPKGSRVLKKIKYSDGNNALVVVDFPKNYNFRDKDIKYEDELIKF